MIKSIYFPKNGNGYIYEKPEKPGPEPDKNDYKYKDFSLKRAEFSFNQGKFDQEHKQWEADKKYYEENKGQFTNQAAKYLIGRKFNFEPGKINIIFGPNGCGKTTILKAISGFCGIAGDGMTKLEDVVEVFGFGDEKMNEEGYKEYIQKLMRNTATVKWDGNVVYYDNFKKTMEMGNTFIGGLVGTALGTLEEEIQYRIGGNKASSGQKAGWMFNKIAAMQEAGLTLKKITEDKIPSRINSVWSKSYKTQVAHFVGLENYDKEVPMTILFDEPEVNFDIPTIWQLYSDVFPKMAEKYGTQIITVSHNPIVLSDEILKNEHVNIISMDEEYTEKVKKFLGKLSF